MPKASPKLNTFKESASASAENHHEPRVKKCGWTTEYCQGPGREHAAALLDISEQSSALESGPYDSPAESGWDEAVTGWGRYPPLACLSQAQKKSKKQSGEADYHCLLCAEVKPTKLPESKENCSRNPVTSDNHQTNKDTPSTERSSRSAVCPRGRGGHKIHGNAAVTVHLERKTPEYRQRHIQGPVRVKNWCSTSIINILPPIMPPGMASGNRTIPHILEKTLNTIGGVTREDRTHCTSIARKMATVKWRGNTVPSAPTENAAAFVSRNSLSKDLPASFSSCIPKKGGTPFGPYVAALPPISCLFEKQKKTKVPQQCSTQKC